MKRDARLARLEAAEPVGLSERVKAWLGQRPPLSPEELAAKCDPEPVDLARLSPELQQWLGRPTE